jgi:ribosome recycling factor
MDVKAMAQAAKPKMEAALQHFTEELKTVRTGRANSQMLDAVMVSYYGTLTPLRQMATISVPEATQLLVQPFDAGSLADIRMAVEQAQLGFSLSDDGRVLRIGIPPLTAERRDEMVKKVGKLAEEARISVRTARGEAWENIQESQKRGEITEDNRDWGRDEIDKLVAEFNKKIEEVAKEKEVELRTV